MTPSEMRIQELEVKLARAHETIEDLRFELNDRTNNPYAEMIRIADHYKLSSSRAAVLYFLALNNGRTVQKHKLLDRARNLALPRAEECEPKVIDIHICHLRRLLDLPIHTSWGRGFSLAKSACDEVLSIARGEAVHG
jgi:DNA-binding response OmpR family regulator